MRVLRLVEPGISRLQGNLHHPSKNQSLRIVLNLFVAALSLYELQKAQVDLAQKLFANKEIAREEFVKTVLECENKLKNAIKLLLYEPRNSPEGRLAQRAMEELRILRNFATRVEVEYKEKHEKPAISISGKRKSKKAKANKK